MTGRARLARMPVMRGTGHPTGWHNKVLQWLDVAHHRRGSEGLSEGDGHH
jgi:hypothetical protein